MLLTMLDLSWKVRVNYWTWIYTFSSKGAVSWRDPFNGQKGSGTWKKEGDKIVTRWHASKTWEEWDVPISIQHATGRCHMAEGTYDLVADCQNFFWTPGDVVTAAGKKYIIYEDQVRSGGTVAWICRNPGNIRSGDRFGALPGKKFQTAKSGAFAIFPNEETGLKAIVSVLRGYGHVTIGQAMKKYAPLGDGANDPLKYGRIVAKRLGVSLEKFVPTLSDEQMAVFADQVKQVEGWTPGETFDRHDPKLPAEVRQRMPGQLTPPTYEEMRNSYNPGP